MNSNLNKIIEKAELVGQRYLLNISSRFSSGTAGHKFGRNTGNSLEYLDHREYQPGDDIRHIDWHALARSDKLTVKLFREEITPHLDLILDCSASMGLENTEKEDGFWAMTAVIKAAAANSSFSFKPWILKKQCSPMEPAGLPIKHWENCELDFLGNSWESLNRMPPKFKNKGVRILVSDLLWEAEPMSVLQQLSDGCSLLIVIHFLSIFDVSPEISGNQRLIDSETGDYIDLMVNEEVLRTYRQNFSRHQEYWKRCCTKTGAVYSLCLAEEFLRDFMPEDLLRSEILMVRS